MLSNVFTCTVNVKIFQDRILQFQWTKVFACELYMQKHKFTKCVIPVYSHCPFVIETIGMLIKFEKNFVIVKYIKIAPPPQQTSPCLH